jgi:hypothetical protein
VPTKRKLNLERGDAPVVVGPVPPRQEIDAEAADHAVACQHMADAPARVTDLQAVPVLRGEVAAQINLARIAAEDLIVRRDVHDLAVGAGPILRARRLLLGSLDELLDDAAHALQFVEVAGQASRRHGHRGMVDDLTQSAGIHRARARHERVALA